MKDQDFSATLLIDKSPEEVYQAINNVRGWWSADSQGSTENLNNEFKLDFESHWWAFKIIETVPNEKVV
ncbi:MAG: hypothetical protein JWR05_162 [Mucilaginibacter sp.]|nr:hypothetical protein [Mucilaginibacter sp.]